VSNREEWARQLQESIKQLTDDYANSGPLSHVRSLQHTCWDADACHVPCPLYSEPAIPVANPATNPAYFHYEGATTHAVHEQIVACRYISKIYPGERCVLPVGHEEPHDMRMK
jgi:hypothetical protein